MPDKSNPELPALLMKYAPWIAAAIVLLVGGPAVYVLVPYYMSLTDSENLIAPAWAVIWLAVVPALSFLIAHVIAGVGNTTAEQASGAKLDRPWSGSLIMLAGVVLPMMAMIVLVPGLATMGFREDPGFTLWHVLLIALIPIGILVPWESVALGRVAHPFWVGPLMGAALAISASYALVALSVFESIAPMLFVDARALLVLAPPVALVCAILVYRQLRMVGNDSTLTQVNKLVICGFALALGALFLPEAAAGIARNAIFDVTFESARGRRAGVRLLRALGLDETVLRYCYRQVVPPIALSEFMPGHHRGERRPVKANEARLTYYRLTGKPFNTVPRPDQWGGLWLRWSDTDVAGEQVGAKADGLALAGSVMEGTVDADSAAGYLEWTLTFKNSSWQPQEARALIALPPEAVVRRVALFVQGKPREAIFSDRTLVRTAYQIDVATHRDPLLVTQVAPDQVLVQCYPVPPDALHETRKVLLGIAMPLPTENGATRLVKLPRIVENNFAVVTNHQFHVASLQPLAKCAVAVKQTPAGDGGPAHGQWQFTDEQLLTVGRPLELSLPTKDDADGAGAAALTRASMPKAAAPNRLLVVIDGSECMSKHLSSVAKALKSVPSAMKTDVLFASDEITALSPDGEVPVELPLQQALRELPLLPCRGGPDNTPALSRAWHKACAEKSGAVLWIHGPQPTLFDNPRNMIESFRVEAKETGSPRIYELEVEPGPNKVIETLDSMPVRFCAVPRLGSVPEDLTFLFDGWTGKARWSVPQFKSRTLGPERVWAAQPKLSAAIRSLKARRQVLDLLECGKVTEAGALASEHRIVSPVTGACVVDRRDIYISMGMSPEQALRLSDARHKSPYMPPLVAPVDIHASLKPSRVLIPPVPAPRANPRPAFLLPPPEPVSPPSTNRQAAPRVASYSGGYQDGSSGHYGGITVQGMSVGGGRPIVGSQTESVSPNVLSGRMSAQLPAASMASASTEGGGGGPADAFSAGVGEVRSDHATGPYFQSWSSGRSTMLHSARNGVLAPHAGDAGVVEGINTSYTASIKSDPASELRRALFGHSASVLGSSEEASERSNVMIWVLRAAVFCAVAALLILMVLPVFSQKRKD